MKKFVNFIFSVSVNGTVSLDNKTILENGKFFKNNNSILKKRKCKKGFGGNFKEILQNIQGNFQVTTKNNKSCKNWEKNLEKIFPSASRL